MTQTSAVIGTAQYLSPEQARGEAVDARSDVYATGCVLYELLCGHPPFVGDNPVSVAYQHVREDPRPPSESNRDVTPSIDAIVLKALAKNPANRYQSAGEMRADLLRAVAGRPVLATPVMRADERTAMIASPTAIMRNGVPTGPSARVAPPPRRKNNTWVAVALTLLGVLAVAALGIGLYVASHNKAQISVPDLKGRTGDEASRLLNQVKLRPSPTQFNDPNCQQNTVTDQTPAAATKVDEGTTVAYRICLGPGETTVPPLVGLTRAAADQALKDKHLVAKFIDVNSDAAAGTVVDSNPKAGTTIKENQTVEVSISKGNQKKVPSVVGKSEADAKAAIAAAGFRVNVVPDETTDTTKIGKVTNQDPDGGTIADPSKTTVSIFVGKASTPTTPPTTTAPTPTATTTTRAP